MPQVSWDCGPLNPLSPFKDLPAHQSYDFLLLMTDSLGHLLPASAPIVYCQTALLPMEGMEQMEYS